MNTKASSYWQRVLAVGAGLLSAVAVQAGDYGLGAAAPDTLPKNTDISGTIGTVIGTVLAYTGTIFFILVVYAGIMWMMAAGNDENIKKAQNILKGAIIGLIIILSAYAITNFFGTQLAK